MLARKTIFILLCSAMALASSRYELMDNETIEPDAVGPVAMVSGSYPSDISRGMIEYFEGCTDTLVWPGLNSGPTIGCGIDLGNIGVRNIRTVFSGLVDSHTVEIMVRAASVRGSRSKNWINRNQVRLTKYQVEASRDRVINMMWKHVSRTMPGIDSAPGEVKTAVLSCAMNRGPNNKALTRLAPLVRARKYKALAVAFNAMQDDHSMPGLRARRSLEADLIRMVVD